MLIEEIKKASYRYNDIVIGDLFYIDDSQLPFAEADGKRKIYMKMLNGMVDLQSGTVRVFTNEEQQNYACIKVEGKLNWWAK